MIKLTVIEFMSVIDVKVQKKNCRAIGVFHCFYLTSLAYTARSISCRRYFCRSNNTGLYSGSPFIRYMI